MGEQPYLLVGLAEDPAGTDCACPDYGPGPTPQLSLAGGHWQIAPGLYRAPLPDGHELLLSPHGIPGTVVLNGAARAVLDAFTAPRPLAPAPGVDGIAERSFAATAERLAVRGLLTPTPAPPPAQTASPHTLTAWLHLTNACNLSCPYCYLDKSDEAMDEQTALQAVDATLRSAQKHGFRAVKLKYAGGEATLNFRLLRLAHTYAQGRASELGLELRAIVLSNGVALTRGMLEFLRSAEISLMISLDGVGQAHDQQRPFVNGRGSFAHVRRAVERALALGIRPELSITVSGRNAEQIAPAVAFALDHDLRFNLNFYRESDLTAAQDDLQADDRRLIAGVRAALAVIAERLPRQRLIDGLLDRSAFHQPHDHACGAGHSYMVVDQRGGIAACQMELPKAVTSVLAPDPLSVIRLTPAFKNVPAYAKEGCATCVWRPWCAGGCPLLTERATGRSDRRSPYCNVYTALYPEVVRLEGLRLLRWAQAPATDGETLERFA